MRRIFLCLIIISQAWHGVSAQQKEGTKDEEIQKIRSILEKVLSTAEDIKQQETRINIMKDIMRAFIKIGDMERTFDIVGRLYLRPTSIMSQNQANEQEALEKKIRNEALNFIVKEVTEIDIEKALLIVDKIDDKNIRQQAFNAVIIRQVRENPENVISIIENIEDLKTKGQALGIFAKEQVKQNPVEGLKTVMKIDDTVIDIKIEAICEIIEIIADANLHRALELVKLIDDDRYKQYAIGVIAVKEVKVDVDLALSRIQEINEPSYKMQTLKKIAEKISEKDLNKAVSIANMIDDFVIKSQTLLNISLKNIDKINKETKK